MRVGVRRVSPKDLSGFHGVGDERSVLDFSTMVRTREKPFECKPVEARPSRMSPGFMADLMGRMAVVAATAPIAAPMPS